MNLKFISTHPAELYYAWQTEIMLDSFIDVGIDLKNVHVVCSYDKFPIHNSWVSLQQKYFDVNFAFYPDNRSDKVYPVSIRPYILKQHFEKIPSLSEGAIFYHDCDMIFTKEIPFDQLLQDDIWYVSDTRSYIGSEYIKSKGHGIFEKMCDIVGLDTDIPVKNEMNSGGAQYIMKNVPVEYWDKVEKDCVSLYRFFLEDLKEHPETSEYNPIQKWTAEMWALLWNIWYFENETKISDVLDFSWATDSIDRWEECSIFHNAGVVATRSDGLFFKGEYIHKLPYNVENTFSKDMCSHKYVEKIIKTANNTCLGEIYERV